MFMYLRLMLTFALLSVFVQTSLTMADDALPTPPFQATLVSGNLNEKLELVFNLHSMVVNDNGQRQFMAADSCRATFVIEARATGEYSYVTTVKVDLHAGDTEVVEIAFAEFGSAGSSHVILTSLSTKGSGPCELLFSERLVGPGGETRFITTGREPSLRIRVGGSPSS